MPAIDLFSTLDELGHRYPNTRVVLPESDDDRILAAAADLSAKHNMCPVLVGKPSLIHAQADAQDLDLSGCELLDPETDERLPELARLYCTERPKSSAKAALRLMRKPLFFGSMIVKAGYADILIAGVAYPSARVIEAGHLCIGLAKGIRTPSSFFLMLVPKTNHQPQRVLLFADCAVNVDPDPQSLADIAVASAASWKRIFNLEPRVAMLSFSTLGSAKHVQVERVREAVNRLQIDHPALAVEGEIQADAALIPAVAEKKINELGPVAGQANVLVFPDLAAANIGYKLVQHLAGARAIGPILQGFARPLSDLSRGATSAEIVMTAQVLSTQL